MYSSIIRVMIIKITIKIITVRNKTNTANKKIMTIAIIVIKIIKAMIIVIKIVIKVTIIILITTK